MRHLLQLAVLVVAALVVGVLLARRRRGGVLALFALLAVGVTYPLAFSPTKVMLDWLCCTLSSRSPSN